MEQKPDIRFILWSGKKFLYFGRNDFRKPIAIPINDLYNSSFSIKDTVYLNILPISCTIRNSIDGSGSASFIFVAPDDKFKFRFQGQNSVGSITGGLVGQTNYRRKIINKFIKPYKNYYKGYGLFNDAYFNNPESYSEPVFMFTPPQIIWIDMRRTEDEGWKRVFTGVVTNISETDTPGRAASITVNCINMLQMTTKIPLMYEKQIVPFAETILPDDEKFRIFWSVYMLSAFMDKKYIGFDPLAETPLSDLYLRLGKSMNRCVGALSETDYDELKDSLKEIDQKVFNPLGRNLTPSDIDIYKEICKEKSFYRFKLFCTDKVEVYEGEDNSVGDTIGLDELFNLEWSISKPAWAVAKIKINKIIRDLEEKDSLNKKMNFPTPFQKMFKFSMGSYFKPKYVMMSNIIRKISTSYGFMSHVDTFGNWIIEYPNFNALPKISTDSTFSQPDEREKIAYDDNDSRYVFQRFDYTTMTYTISPDKFVSFVELPFSYNIANVQMNEILQNMFTGRSWGDIEQILYYGLNEVNMESLYFNIGSLGMNEKDFLYKMTDYFKERLNSEVWSINMSNKLRPDVQVGRIAIVIPQERKYFISEVSHTINVGSDASTTMSLTHGRTYDEELAEPWKYFMNNVTDVSEVGMTDTQPTIETPSTEYTKNTTDEEQTKSQVKEVTGIDLKNSSNVIETIRRMHLEPMPVKEGFAQSFADVSFNFVGCDERILLAIGEMYYYMKDWFLNNDKIKVNEVMDLKFYIWSVVRSKANEYDKSRHISGRAIDIGGLRLVYKDEDNVERILETSIRGEKETSYKERYIPDAMFDFIKNILKVNNYKFYCNNDAYPISEDKNISYFIFHPNGCIALPGYDCKHIHHIHLSVGANTI